VVSSRSVPQRLSQHVPSHRHTRHVRHRSPAERPDVRTVSDLGHVNRTARAERAGVASDRRHQCQLPVLDDIDVLREIDRDIRRGRSALRRVVLRFERQLRGRQLRVQQFDGSVLVSRRSDRLGRGVSGAAAVLVRHRVRGAAGSQLQQHRQHVRQRRCTGLVQLHVEQSDGSPAKCYGRSRVHSARRRLCRCHSAVRGSL